MLRCSNRQLSPFRNEARKSESALKIARRAAHSQSRQGVSTDTRMKIQMEQQENENASCVKIIKVEDLMNVKKGGKSMAIDPPGIALSSSSSSSSVSSTSATIDVRSAKTTIYRTSILPPPPPPPPPPMYHGGHWYPPYPAETGYPRGMVPASPHHPRTPPTQGSNRLQPPPKVFRVTSKPSSDSNLYWTPFVANRQYSDLYMQQQLQQQRQQRCAPYHHNYWRYPSHVPSNHPLPTQSGPYVLPGYHCAPEVIGHPSLRIYKLQLPASLMKLLDQIVGGCELHAQGRPSGWRTDLYSLTRQDLALMDVPGMMEKATPILHYLSRCICEVYHANRVKVDRNQPHILKYNQDHRGVELHHDRCDVTANLMMSRSHTYAGGGTYFPDLNKVVRLKYGEFLLHPGSLVHGGTEISKGTRYLMVLFAHLK